MTLGQRIATIYEQFPEFKKELDDFTISYDTFIQDADSCSLNDLSLDSLCSIDKDKGRHLAIFLANLPKKVLWEEFGDDAFFWTFVQYPYSDAKEHLRCRLGQYNICDPLIAEKSRLSVWQHFYGDDPRVVKKQCDLHTALQGDILTQVPLNDLLKENTSPKESMSDKRASRYGLHITQSISDYVRGRDVKWGYPDISPGQRAVSVYMDTPVGFTLTYKGQPNAVAGFLAKDAETLFVKQLQSLRPVTVDEDGKYKPAGSSQGLIPQLNWPQTLLGCVTNIAKSQGFSKIGIQSAKNNIWIEPDRDGKPHMTKERAIEIYDDLAIEKGFILGEKDNWYKDITS